MLSDDHTELLATEGNDSTANKMSITSGITYQQLLKTIVKPPTAQPPLNNLLVINSVDWTKVFILLLFWFHRRFIFDNRLTGEA